MSCWGNRVAAAAGKKNKNWIYCLKINKSRLLKIIYESAGAENAWRMKQ